MDPIDEEGNAPDASSDTESPETADYELGYDKPPMIMRFKPEESGNRRGRPRGSKNRKTIVREIAHEMHTVVEQDGRRRRRSTLELMLLALCNLAAGGNVRAFRAYKKYLEKYEPQETNSNVGVLVVPAPMTIEEAIEEGEKANEEARARREAKLRGKS